MSGQRTSLAKGRYMELVERDSWEYVDRVNVRDVVAVVAITGEEEIVLVEQYRVPVAERVIELPAGLVGDDSEHRDEGVLEGARRELEEETGYRSGSLTFVARLPSSAGMTSEMVTFVHAGALEKLGSGGGVGNEDIKVHVVPLSKLRRWLVDMERYGNLVDPKIYAGLFLLELSCDDPSTILL